MRTIMILLLALVVSASVAQNYSSKPFIEVTGSAEMTLVPDQLVLEIVLVSSSDSKSSVEEMEKNFLQALDRNKIPKMVLSFVSADNPNPWYYNYNTGYSSSSNSILSQPSSDIPTGDYGIPSIKLRFEIKAKFEII